MKIIYEDACTGAMRVQSVMADYPEAWEKDRWIARGSDEAIDAAYRLLNGTCEAELASARHEAESARKQTSVEHLSDQDVLDCLSTMLEDYPEHAPELRRAIRAIRAIEDISSFLAHTDRRVSTGTYMVSRVERTIEHWSKP